jgi:ribosomal-protein-alanine N-acetyltransferase
MSPPRFVKLSPEHFATLAEIAAECGLQVDFSAELARSYASVWVALVDETPLGFALVWRAAGELQLTDLGVTAKARRKGLARALLAELRREGIATGAEVMLLEVRASNLPALELYRSFGFKELDRRPRYYPDTGEDAVVMQLGLR